MGIKGIFTVRLSYQFKDKYSNQARMVAWGIRAAIHDRDISSRVEFVPDLVML